MSGPFITLYRKQSTNRSKQNYRRGKYHRWRNPVHPLSFCAGYRPAIKMPCCNTYYPCIECHTETAGHEAEYGPAQHLTPLPFYAASVKMKWPLLNTFPAITNALFAVQLSIPSAATITTCILNNEPAAFYKTNWLRNPVAAKFLRHCMLPPATRWSGNSIPIKPLAAGWNSNYFKGAMESSGAFLVTDTKQMKWWQFQVCKR